VAAELGEGGTQLGGLRKSRGRLLRPCGRSSTRRGVPRQWESPEARRSPHTRGHPGRTPMQWRWSLSRLSHPGAPQQNPVRQAYQLSLCHRFAWTQTKSSPSRSSRMTPSMPRSPLPPLI